MTSWQLDPGAIQQNLVKAQGEMTALQGTVTQRHLDTITESLTWTGEVIAVLGPVQEAVDALLKVQAQSLSAVYQQSDACFGNVANATRAYVNGNQDMAALWQQRLLDFEPVKDLENLANAAGDPRPPWAAPPPPVNQPDPS